MISSIRLQNFRSYADDSFEFEPGVNIVVGPNASGKTNLLEAVLVLCRGSSYRARDPELIRFNKPWARLDGFYVHQNRILKLEKSDAQPTKTFLLDAKPYKRLSLDKTVPIVYFEPNHLQLITRGPEQRRDYFDELLERSTPGYKTLLASYRRALAQRNTLLKHGPAFGAKQLFAWNIRLSELGEKIAVARMELAESINKNLARNYSKISKRKTKLEVSYDAQFPIDSYANRLLSKLEKTINEDYQKGFTGCGPHREDFSFILNGQPANVSASRGEARSIMLALKIFELNLIEQVRGAKAIFLLDDVFSELDGARRRALVDYLEDRQTIITTTDADTVLEYFTHSTRIIPID
jgi:DNA replication and repair protein RecF